MSVKLLLDENLSPSAAIALVAGGIDACHVRDRGILGATDHEVLDAIPIPGHSKLSIALYDRRTQILFSGDTLYPGRLYVFDFPAFEASIARLAQFTADRPVAHVIGNHIEQTSTPFRDFPIGTLFQRDDHELALSRGSLLELQAAPGGMHGAPRRLALRDFTIFPAGPEFRRPEEIEQARRYIEEQRNARWQRAPAP